MVTADCALSFQCTPLCTECTHIYVHVYRQNVGMCMSAPLLYWHGISSPDYYFITELGKKYGINRRNPLLPWCARSQAVTGHFPSHHAVSQQPSWTGSSCRPLCIPHHRKLHSPTQLLPRFTPTHARKLVSKKRSI